MQKREELNAKHKLELQNKWERLGKGRVEVKTNGAFSDNPHKTTVGILIRENKKQVLCGTWKQLIANSSIEADVVWQ